MKYPDPTFLTRADKVRKTRHTRTILIIVFLLIITLAILFVSHIAALQKKYAEQFPDLVGAATSTVESTKPLASAKDADITEEVESTSEATEETTEMAAIIATENESQETEATAATSQNNSPDAFEESDIVEFTTTRSLQTVSHEERDVKLDSLKQEITDYMNANPGERIAVRYVNLLSNETMGINDLEPVIPAGSFTLPLETVYWEQVALGLRSPTQIVTYNGDYIAGSSSYIVDTYEPGKQFFIRTCLNLAVTENDNLAQQFVIDALGGIDNAWSHISSISSFINYGNSVIYTDYTGTQQRGPYRTSAYDLANYAEYLYHGYLNDPDTYGRLISDLKASRVPTGITQAFDDALILHCAGRNNAFRAYSDVAIIDGVEPIVVVICCECQSAERATTIQADIATYIARFINECHS